MISVQKKIKNVTSKRVELNYLMKRSSRSSKFRTICVPLNQNTPISRLLSPIRTSYLKSRPVVSNWYNLQYCKKYQCKQNTETFNYWFCFKTINLRIFAVSNGQETSIGGRNLQISVGLDFLSVPNMTALSF